MEATLSKMDRTGLEAVCDLIADTERGLTGSQIIKFCKEKASEYGVIIPVETTNFKDMGIPNKRTALRMNLEVFSFNQQCSMIDELSRYRELQDNGIGEQVCQYMLRRYHREPSSIETTFKTESMTMLDAYPKTKKALNQTLTRVQQGEYDRTTLDGMRFALEQLLQEVLGNGAVLENNTPALGGKLKDRGAPSEIRNMLTTLINYFSNYQNNHVKHHDEIRSTDYRFIIDFTLVVIRYIAATVQ